MTASATERSSVRLSTALLLAVWTLPGVVDWTEVWISNAMAGRPYPWWRIGVVQMPGWYLWAAMTPLIFWISGRFPLRRGMTITHVVAHVGAWIGCSAAHAVVIAVLSRTLDATTYGLSFPAYVGQAALAWLPSTFLIYCATVGVAHWMQAMQRERQHERDQSSLSVRLATAELNALRSQLHPHFLFNTLNTIAILIRERDTDVAVRLVAQLGDILRQVLRTSRTHETQLAQEVAFVRAYLDIEQVRFGDRLSVRWQVPDELLEAAVPVLVLQPLVENAVRHGIACIEDAGVLEVGAVGFPLA